MIPAIRYPAHNPTEAQVIEQLEYLNGTLWGEPEHRLDMTSDRNISNEIDRFGNCSRHFWRAVIDIWGMFALYESRGYKYPRLQLTGSYWFLMKFLAFLKEELGPAIDPEGKLAFACSGNRLMFSGAPAKDVVVLLYAGAEVGLSGNSARADEVMVWSPRR